MRLRFYLDDDGTPHVHQHHVSAEEVEAALRKPLEDIRGRGVSRVAIGQTRSGRYLRVIYSPDDDGEGIFVITAHDLPARQLRALRRRLKRRRR